MGRRSGTAQRTSLRKFEFNVRMQLNAEGTYYAVFKAETTPTKNVTLMFEVLKPKIDIVADRTLGRGGEEIKVETSPSWHRYSLGSPIWIHR